MSQNFSGEIFQAGMCEFQVYTVLADIRLSFRTLIQRICFSNYLLTIYELSMNKILLQKNSDVLPVYLVL